jgi:hypothetical protein
MIKSSEGGALRLYLRRCRPVRYFVMYHALKAETDRSALLDALGLESALDVPSAARIARVVGFLPRQLLPGASERGAAWMRGWAEGVAARWGVTPEAAMGSSAHFRGGYQGAGCQDAGDDDVLESLDAREALDRRETDQCDTRV